MSRRPVSLPTGFGVKIQVPEVKLAKPSDIPRADEVQQKLFYSALCIFVEQYDVNQSALMREVDLGGHNMHYYFRDSKPNVPCIADMEAVSSVFGFTFENFLKYQRHQTPCSKVRERLEGKRLLREQARRGFWKK